MTYDQYEKGETLTIHNATKEQLKWMVKDKESAINRLYEELENEKASHKKTLDWLGELVLCITETYGAESLKNALLKAKENANV